MYLCAIETFICHTKIEFNMVYFLWFFAQHYIIFEYCIELIVTLYSPSATKTTFHGLKKISHDAMFKARDFNSQPLEYKCSSL